MTKLLIVEDTFQIREAVTDFFEQKSAGAFQIDCACDGDEGMRAVTDNDYDLVILDIMLPGPSGFEICRKLRQKSDCPIVFLTALGTEDNILSGYEMGADEYMVKPFSLKVLYTKCLVLLDRAGKRKQEERVLESGQIKLYPSRMQVFVGEDEIDLAPKEYFLLKALLENKGHVLGRSKLLDLVWGLDFFGSDRVVDSHIKKVRHKLGPAGDQIKTVIGGGYKAV
ncbi:MAG: response regulator transcription factor [Clostridiales bacterium]|nr:response regulator transcription factor [Clostridiales bacterium]